MAYLNKIRYALLATMAITILQTICGQHLKTCMIPSSTKETIADRSNRTIKHFPTDFPLNTTEIDLNHNMISVIKTSQRLYQLLCLDMSYNYVHRLETNTFSFCPNLQGLHLSHNRLNFSIKTYPWNVFNSLPRLKILHLNNNDLTDVGSYPEKALGQLKHLEELSIDTFSSTVFGAGFGHMMKLKRLQLGFRGCKLMNLRNGTFINFAEIKLEYLNLEYCRQWVIEVNAFSYFRTLSYLLMSHNSHLGPKNALLSLYGLRNRNISVIELNGIIPFKIPRKKYFENIILSSNAFSNIHDVCVKNVSMKHNLILWMSFVANPETQFAKCIEHLDLSDNDMHGDITQLYILVTMPNLRYYDISRHGFKNRGCFNENQKEALEEKTNITHIVPSRLEYMMFNYVFIYPIGSIELHVENARSLRELQYTYNGVDASSSRLFGLENITTLDFSVYFCGNILPTFFDDVPCLSKLSMSDCALNYQKEYFTVVGFRLLKPLKKLETIILSHNDLSRINPNLFKGKSIKFIHLSYKRFEHIPLNLQTTDYLEFLDLRFNFITILEQSEMDSLDQLGTKNNLTLNLFGNILSCGCSTLNQIFWLYNTGSNIKDIEAYSCIREDGSLSSISDTYQNLDMVWRKCSGRYWLAISISLLSVIILAMAIIYILCRRKTMIFNVILRLFGFNTLVKQPSRKDFKFDVFLGYSEYDYQYACHTVRELLESEDNIRTFITDRDMLPGRSISQEIVTAVDTSWRIVLILTQAFLEDNWCHFITDYAVYVSTFRPSGCVVLVLFDDVRKGDIPPAVLNVVDEDRIFIVKNYEEDDPSLWKDVSSVIIKI